MDTASRIHPLPIPEGLRYRRVSLQFSEFIPPQGNLGLAGRYIFHILNSRGDKVGYISFRVGDSWHVQHAAGHIGYRVSREHQGRRYAYQACCALAPFMRTVYPSVILTTSLTNIASIRTIERLGAKFLEVVDIPIDDPAFASGDLQRRRYEWNLQEESLTTS